MQDMTQKSQVIRLNNLANKKARRRLIGSIFLLIVALLILFHVSSKIKPIPIKPESIELKTHNKSTSSDVLRNPIIIESQAILDNKKIVLESNIIATSKNTSTNQVSSKTIGKVESSTGIHKDIKMNNSLPLKPSNNNNISMDNPDTKPLETKSLASEPAKTKPVNLHITPTIAIEQSSAHKITPEDILNGVTPDKPKPKYFVQFMASNDKTKLIAVKTKLAHYGIYTNIQSVKRGDSTIYRLRTGPFKDKEKAKSKLIEIQDKLNN